MKKHHNNSSPKYLTVKELKPLRGGKVAIVFRQHEEPYKLSVQDSECFKSGMRVMLYKGKLSPC